MYLYEARNNASITGDRYRFWSKSPYVLHNYTIETDGEATYHGHGYETFEACRNAARRELKKWDALGIGAGAWYTEHVERVEVTR